MSTTDTAESEIEIRPAETDPFGFFYSEVPDATPLDNDPWDRAWEAVVDDDVAGMLAVEEFSTPCLVRLAVREEYRGEGVATALVEHAKTEQAEWYGYVDEGNEACQALLDGLGFQEGGYAPPPNLECWRWQRDGDSS